MCIVCEAPSREAMFEHFVIVLIIIPLGMLLFGRVGSEVFCLFVCHILPGKEYGNVPPSVLTCQNGCTISRNISKKMVRSRENVKGEYQYYQ